MPRRQMDPVTDAFERYIALTAEQRALFAAQVAGYNHHLKGSTAAVKQVGRPAGSKNRTKANGPEQPEATA